MKKISLYLGEHMEMLQSDGFVTTIAALAVAGIVVLVMVV